LAEFTLSTVAVVGGETLLARELRELLSEIQPRPDVRLVSGEADATEVTRDPEGEAQLIAPLDENLFRECKAIFLAGSPETARKAVDLSVLHKPALIDLTGVLEDHPQARLRAPQLENSEARSPDSIHVIAHPAAISLAMVFSRIAPRFPIERSVVEVFEPASELGQKGLTELQTQTVNLLSFKPLPKEVYDAQVSFNMLAAYGSESPNSIDAIEAKIDRHLATLLLISSHAVMPSLRLVQAPVFHGYSCSLWMEFEKAPGVEALEEAIASAQIEVRRSSEEPPNNVGVAGESGLIVGGIRADRNHPRAYWLWLVTDNIRLFADTAVSVAKEYL
jgi:aspartate-semialdehyde dehydrogenase